MTVDALVQLLHHYYPSGLWPDEPAYEGSAEAQRLSQRVVSSRRDTRTWEGFVEQLHRAFPDCQLWDTTMASQDPCFNLRLGLPGSKVGGGAYDTLVCLVSMLAPVYALYGSHVAGSASESWLRFSGLPAAFQSHEARLASLVESSFGFTRLHEAILFTPVSDLAPRSGDVALGEARLIDCLLTPHRF